MAATGRLGDAVLFLGTDDSKLQKGLGDAEQRTSGWGSAMQGVMAGIGIAIADVAMNTVRSAIDTIGQSVTAASDLQETISKTGQIFGDSTASVLAWSEDTAAAIGQSQQAALDGVATFGIFGKAAGLTGEDLANFSTDLVNLGSDLASFNNTSPEQAVEALGAALRGESEPLRSYGVLLDDATLKAAAFQMGLTDSNTATLTAQQRILAAQKVIFEQTQTQQGDFARTSDGLANSQRTLQAQWDNFKATMGGVFLPIVEQVTRVISNLAQTVMPPLQEVIENRIVPAIQGLSERFGVFLEGKGRDLAQWIVDAISGFGDFVTELTTMDTQTAQRTGSMAGQFLSLFDSIKETMDALSELFASSGEGDVYSPGLKGLFELLTDIVDLIGVIMDGFSMLGEAAKKVVSGDWTGLGEMSQEFWDWAYRGGFPVDPSKVSPDVLNDPDVQRQRGQPPPVQGEPDVTYTVQIPIVINAQGATPDVVAQAANGGVTSALRSAGITP